MPTIKIDFLFVTIYVFIMSSLCITCQGTGVYQCRYRHPGQLSNSSIDCKFGALCRNQKEKPCKSCHRQDVKTAPKRPPMVNKGQVQKTILEIDKQNPTKREDFIAVLAERSTQLLDLIVQAKLKDPNFSLDSILGDSGFGSDIQTTINTLDTIIDMLK